MKTSNRVVIEELYTPINMLLPMERKNQSNKNSITEM